MEPVARTEAVRLGALLNIGCGTSAPPDWQNVDVSPRVLLKSVPVLGRLLPSRFPANVQYGNIVRGLRMSPRSCRAVFCCHMIEHLTFQDCQRALTNIYELLAAEGVFRVIVPDLRRLATVYLDHEAEDAASRLMRWSGLGEEATAPALHRLFGNSRHRWMWDERSLSQALRASGFSEVRPCVYGDNPVFASVESQERYADSVALEAVRTS